jgi:hypothetical protein
VSTKTSARAALLDHFREQAGFCIAMGSPFTAGLIEVMAGDLEAGGPVADLVSAWPGSPRADAVSLRLTGALHAAAMTGRDEALRDAYRPPGPHWEARLWPAVRAFLARDRDWVAEFLRLPPQTNEARRSIGLLAGFLRLVQRFGTPIDTLEIGASAGLNLSWDGFAYRTASWAWGGPSPVAIDTDWRGPPPPLPDLSVRSRRACDLNPLDVADPVERLRLRSYVWPDQVDRLARFDAAVDLALATGVKVERANAADWLEARLAERSSSGLTVVYHSVFLQYPPRDERIRIVRAIEAAGARATAAAPLAWLRLEPEAVFGPRASNRFLIDLVTWPGGERELLAETDGHVRFVDARIAAAS